MSIHPNRLRGLLGQLSTRPGHEKVRTLVNELCEVGLNVPPSDIEFEVRVPEVRGRIDAVFGSTVFEFKRDLRRETNDAESQLLRYISEREQSTNRRYLGIATDGAEFVAYEVTDGNLRKLQSFKPDTKDPRALLEWLDSAVAIRDELVPDPLTIRAEFGRDSLVFIRSMETLRQLWQSAADVPEAELKYELWTQHLEFVYGTLIEPEKLFLQHTYLTIVAKSMAFQALGERPASADELLAGTPFTQVGLKGAVETDFFDWVRLAPGGSDLVDRISRQVSRFRLSDIDTDVLKTIYESLIDPQQRHYLGEYYTPDWLAEWVYDHVVSSPLEEKLFDPACGSGTFLFHAVRKFLDAADAAGIPVQTALEQCTQHVVGLDVHPVAVLFSRVTYLLAIGPERLSQRTDDLYVPVYLGDALQWDIREFLSEQEIEISVPNEKPLRFPGKVAGDPKLLEKVLIAMRDYADDNASIRAFRSWLNGHTRLPSSDRNIVAESYEHMRALHRAGRNHIWTYIIRNLTRPLWLSMKKARPDIVLGNPPWLKFNAMSGVMQERFREACKSRNLWVGGRVATQQDLSAYFFARVTERYLSKGGKIAFVMPMAALSRNQFRGFLSGSFVGKKDTFGARVTFNEAWKFGNDVEPLFPVPSCVMFAERTEETSPLPSKLTSFRGNLPLRDASANQARRHLEKYTEEWTGVHEETSPSPYKKLIKNGASIFPRRLFVVEEQASGKLGKSKKEPLVQSRLTAQDKEPWKSVKPIKGQIETEFLRPLLLGESIGPFRILSSCKSIIPWSQACNCLMDSKLALEKGYPHLSKWLRTAEANWEAHKKENSDMSLTERIDFYKNLSSQFPITKPRVVYAKAGVNPASCVVHDRSLVIDHMLYWMATDNVNEAYYLSCFFNSDFVRGQIAHKQSQGQFGARHFDKVMLSLPIPRFDSRNHEHVKLAKLGKRAENNAAALEIPERYKFQRARKFIRDHLHQSGMTHEIDTTVGKILS